MRDGRDGQPRVMNYYGTGLVSNEDGVYNQDDTQQAYIKYVLDMKRKKKLAAQQNQNARDQPMPTPQPDPIGPQPLPEPDPTWQENSLIRGIGPPSPTPQPVPPTPMPPQQSWSNPMQQYGGYGGGYGGYSPFGNQLFSKNNQGYF